MKKTEATRILTSCAKMYRDNLENRNLLFVYGDREAPAFLESVFLPRCFRHLTGVVTKLSSTQFYERCLKGKLAETDYDFDEIGFTVKKLEILPKLMHIHRNAKMVANFSEDRIYLRTDKLVGTITAILGLCKDGNYFIPNTALKSDIRIEASEPPKRLLAVYRKAVRDETYSELCYLAKGEQPERMAEWKDIYLQNRAK